MVKSDLICVVESRAITALKFEENGLALICEVPYKNTEKRGEKIKCFQDV